MNAKEKVVAAINYYEASCVEVGNKAQQLNIAQQQLKDAEAELVRTLHAVYGDRSEHGVVLRGKRYAAVQKDTSEPRRLETSDVKFEVLG
ncbi:MAG: hypothetical protein ACYC4U_11245 [Pirellulaceae bacterium]